MSQLELTFGSNVLSRYKDLNYKLWYAIAEFVDNSSQSYLDNRKELDASRDEKFNVKIGFENGKSFKIIDNAYGMDEKGLRDALIVGRMKEKSQSGYQRSEFGMGLKTGGFWMGKKIEITTKKYNHEKTYSATLDLNKIIEGNSNIELKASKQNDLKDSFTIIKISDFHRQFSSYALTKTKDILSSLYSLDIDKKIMKIFWNGTEIESYKRTTLIDEGNELKWDVNLNINNKKITGFVGLLKQGGKDGSSRKNAGFSVGRNGRMLYCAPNFFRPTTVFGQEGGTNDLVNQRVFGHLEFENTFGVTQAKDQIVFSGDEEDKFLKEIKEVSSQACHFAKYADHYNKTKKKHNPIVNDEMQNELSDSVLDDIIDKDISLVNDDETRDEAYQYINSIVKKDKPVYDWAYGKLGRRVKVYINTETDVRAPYLATDPTSSDDGEVIVVINGKHPHYNKVATDNEKELNFIKSCVYDGIVESILMKTPVDKIIPTTFRKYKDELLRQKFLQENI